GLDVERDWDDLLSLEEQRLFNIARILLAAPRFAVLADLDDGIGSARARYVLAQLAARGIGCLELAADDVDRQGVASATIEIAPDGSWQRTPSAPVKSSLP